MKPVHLTKSRQGGVMLLEALLGILIFSVGILAVVGMQAMAIKTVSESKYRMDAGFLANQVIGEMWLNRANLGNYAYSGGTWPTELEDWGDKVEAALPGAASNPPEILIGANNMVTVTLFWQHPEEAGLPSPPPPHQYRAVTMIDCC